MVNWLNEVVRVGVHPTLGYVVYNLLDGIGSISLSYYFVQSLSQFTYPKDVLGREYICQDEIGEDISLGCDVFCGRYVYIVTSVGDPLTIANHQGPPVEFTVPRSTVVLAKLRS